MKVLDSYNIFAILFVLNAYNIWNSTLKASFMTEDLQKSYWKHLESKNDVVTYIRPNYLIIDYAYLNQVLCDTFELR